VDLSGKIQWSFDPYPKQESLIVQVGWTPDGKLLAEWQDRVQTWLDLRLYQDNGESQVVIHETSPAWTERLRFPQYLKDGSFIWESDRSGHRHLYHYDKNYQLSAAITKGDWDVRYVYGIDEQNNQVLFSANQHNPIGNDVYAINLDGTGQTRLTHENGSHFVRWNQDFSQFIDSWSSLQQTPKQALFTRDGTQLKLVDNHGLPATIRQLKLAKMTQQQIMTRDGFAMESLLFLPSDFDPKKKYPVYQHLYAGPMAPQVTDRWNANLWHHFLAQQGYIVWVLDNRSASNKGVQSAWPIHRKLGQLELEDQLDGLEWLKNKAGQTWTE